MVTDKQYQQAIAGMVARINDDLTTRLTACGGEETKLEGLASLLYDIEDLIANFDSPKQADDEEGDEEGDDIDALNVDATITKLQNLHARISAGTWQQEGSSNA